MSSTKIITIPPEHDNSRLDKSLSALIDGISRARLQTLIADGQVRVNGTVETNQKVKIKSEDEITLLIPDVQPTHLEAENIPLDIIYEDEALLVINKPAGMVVHPGAGNPNGTLVNALLYHCGDNLSHIGDAQQLNINGVARPGIVHRLDKDTSGLMMVAKTDRAHQGLSDQLADRSLSRQYEALVWGLPIPPFGTIDKAIGRHPQDRLKMSTRGVSMREARTHYKVIKHDENRQISHVECALDTGRTHQIRVHFEVLGHALVGDPTYGAQKTKCQSSVNKSALAPSGKALFLTFPRQALHAKAIKFIHPVTGEEHSYQHAPPADLAALVAAL